MFERFTREARNVVKAAVAAADARGESHVGTEHLLLAIGDANDPAVSGALGRSGVEPGAFQRALTEYERASLSSLGLDPELAGPGPRASRHKPFTAGAKECLEETLKVALARGDKKLGVEHITLAILGRSERDPAIQVIRRLGVEPSMLARALDDELRRSA
jgi:ATP-dependent Clp protease ATP-binding subunit ClpA